MLEIVGLIVLVVMMLIFLAHYNIWRPRKSYSFPRVLMYHSVAEEIGDIHPELSVRPENFRKQIEYLVKQKFSFYTVSEMLTESSKNPAVCLTFDDGFSDNYDLVFPILKELGLKATIYLAPEIQGVCKVTKEQVEEMQESGLVEFGAHTVNHVNLKDVDEKLARQEIVESKEWVEAITKVKCISFSYPFGRFTSNTKKILLESDFRSAVTVKKGCEMPLDPMSLKRISVLRSTNLLQFKIAISRGRYRL